MQGVDGSSPFIFTSFCFPGRVCVPDFSEFCRILKKAPEYLGSFCLYSVSSAGRAFGCNRSIIKEESTTLASEKKIRPKGI